MADLRAFQNTTQPQGARLQAIPAPSPTPSAVSVLASGAAGLASTIGAEVASARQAEAQTKEQTFVGDLSGKLLKAQQAGQTNPKYDTASEQRKIIQKAIADNPQFSEVAMDTFKTATGLEVAGLSREEEQRIAMQNEAWTNGYGSPNASPAYNEQQLQLYTSLQRESTELGLTSQRLQVAEAENRIGKAQMRDEVIKQTNKLANLKFQSTELDMQDTLTKIQSGELTVDQARQEWAMKRIQLNQELSAFGELRNDPDVIAMVQPTFDMFDMANDMFTAKYQTEEIQRQIDIAKQRAEASIIVNQPENTLAIVTSNLFGHTIGNQAFMSKAVSQILTQGPADLRILNNGESQQFQDMIRTSLKDPASEQEAIDTQAKVINHFSRNGMDYTDEQKLNLAKQINNPEIWNKMTLAQRQEVEFAFTTYMTDVVQNSVRAVDQMGKITIPEYTYTATGNIATTSHTTLNQDQYSQLVIDDAGARFEMLPEYRNSRQVQQHVFRMNKELSSINEILDVMSGVSGNTKEETAAQFLGLSQTMGPAEPGVTETDDISGAFTRWYQENLVEPTAVGEREAAARQLGARITGREAPVQAPEQDFRGNFIQTAVADGMSQEDAEALYDELNAPATEATVNIGGQELSMEAARQLLSTPAR